MSYKLDDLVYLMQRLRDPVDGCPWDRKQTPRTIINYSLEEVYELAEAIEQGDSLEIQGELGDLLFQVVFYAQIAKESGDFCLDDIIHGLVEKLIMRHPHVFPAGNINSRRLHEDKLMVDESVVNRSWEAIKRREREAKNQAGLFANIPLALPALRRAEKLQKRAATVGFDWPSLQGPMEKINEELHELCELLDCNTTGNENSSEEHAAKPESTANSEVEMAKIEEELGDVLFSCVNLARQLGINAEQALRSANRKFVRRIEAVDDMARQQQQEITQLDEGQLDRLWRRAKAREGAV